MSIIIKFLQENNIKGIFITKDMKIYIVGNINYTLKDGVVIDGVKAIRDESDREASVRIVIELKRDVNAKIILNQLYKNTQLQDTFGIIMLALVSMSFSL